MKLIELYATCAQEILCLYLILSIDHDDIFYALDDDGLLIDLNYEASEHITNL